MPPAREGAGGKGRLAFGITAAGLVLAAIVVYVVTRSGPPPAASEASSKPAATAAANPEVVAPPQAPAPTGIPAVPTAAPSEPSRPTPPAAQRTPQPTPTKTAAEPAVRTEAQAVSSGAVDAEALREPASRVVTHLRLCGRLQLARDPSTPIGTVGVTLVVSPEGAVAQVRLDRGVEGTPIGDCLKAELPKIRFPAFQGRPLEIRRTVDLGTAPQP